MNKELPIPSVLKEIPTWFASIVDQSPNSVDPLQAVCFENERFQKEVADYIRPNSKLHPFQRIRLYHEQYWLRILEVLKGLYPFVSGLLGEKDFYQLVAIPYIKQHPSSHWNLDCIGDRLLNWLKIQPQLSLQPLLYQAALLDSGYNLSWFAPLHKPFSKQLSENMDFNEVAEKTLFTQPHVKLFSFDWNLLTLREDILEGKPLPSSFISNPLKSYFILYRSLDHYIHYQSLSLIEFNLLQAFYKGSNLCTACEEVLERYPQEAQNIEINIGAWFQLWSANNWLTFEKVF